MVKLSQDEINDKYGDWLSLELTKAELAKAELDNAMLPRDSSVISRCKVPEFLVDLMLGIYLPDNTEPLHWAQWVMELG